MVSFHKIIFSQLCVINIGGIYTGVRA